MNEGYIREKFNLNGLDEQISDYHEALDMILDEDPGKLNILCSLFGISSAE